METFFFSSSIDPQDCLLLLRVCVPCIDHSHFYKIERRQFCTGSILLPSLCTHSHTQQCSAFEFMNVHKSPLTDECTLVTFKNPFRFLLGVLVGSYEKGKCLVGTRLIDQYGLTSITCASPPPSLVGRAVCVPACVHSSVVALGRLFSSSWIDSVAG